SVAAFDPPVLLKLHGRRDFGFRLFIISQVDVLSLVLLTSCTARRHRLARSCCFSNFRWLALSCSFSVFRRSSRFRWLTFTFSRSPRFSTRLLRNLPGLRTLFLFLLFSFFFLLRTGDARERKTTN